MHEFRKCVARYAGDHRIRTFSCWDQFLCLLFAQLSYRESLRDIVACLRSQSQRLYHMGFRSRISRTTLARANEVRDWRIYADFAQVLIAQARKLYRDEDLGIELSNTVYPASGVRDAFPKDDAHVQPDDLGVVRDPAAHLVRQLLEYRRFLSLLYS